MRNQLDREHGESGDIYDRVVVRLNEKWRVVECRAGIQWILQRRKSASDGGGWSSRSFCRTSEAIRRLARQHAKPIDPEALVVLDRLPEWIEEVDHLHDGDQLQHPDGVDRVDREGPPTSPTSPSQHRHRAGPTSTDELTRCWSENH